MLLISFLHNQRAQNQAANQPKKILELHLILKAIPQIPHPPNNKYEAKYMYNVGAYKVNQDGTEHAFWANRIGNDESWLSATWNIKINNILKPGGDIFVMLDAFHSFADRRQIVFSTDNNACDYKRLTSAYLWKPHVANLFPPENEWLTFARMNADNKTYGNQKS